MCGIAGIAGEENARDLARGMTGTFRYRGPDDEGSCFDPADQVALAMCRLSIIDLSSGYQPMSNEDDTLWIVCNGEIYNSPELRARLTARGHHFKTKNSDVETLLHLYEDKGEDMLSDLNGMFAFVIYDKKARRLFGARDRMGIKPFYYVGKEGKFAFASELKALLTLPWVSREVCGESVHHYLSFQYVPAPQSIFQDIKKLPAGHSFRFDLAQRQLTTKAYWDLDVTREETLTPSLWEERIRQAFGEAVARWTLSDVPIACSLSGGLDSSSIVGMLARHGFKDIRTYSLGFAEAGDLDELPLARMVARKWGTQHQEFILTADKVLNDLDRMVWHLDEPYAGGLPSWYIYEMIGRDVKVAMTGSGGDELFGNYRKYRWMDAPAPLRWLKTVKESWTTKSLDEAAQAARYPFGHFYPLYFSDAEKKKMFARQEHSRFSSEGLVESLARASGSRRSRGRISYTDFHTQLPEEFLCVTDRFSMAHSVEARVPFLDHELVELVYRMPDQLRAMPGAPKGFLKRVIGDLLPPELLMAPKKGFILPLTAWTRKELRPVIEELLHPDALKGQGIFSPEVYRAIVKPHLDGRRDHTQKVWTLFMFQKWHRIFVETKT